METSLTVILYQNMLFGEGLESILQKNNFSTTKLPFPKDDFCIKAPYNNPKLLIIEFDWPFHPLDDFIVSNSSIFNNGTQTILISNKVDQYIIRLIHRRRVDGLILKHSDAEELIFAVKQVLEGKKYYSSVVTNLVLKNDVVPEEIVVTKREKQILSLLAEMKTTSEIAEKLSVSPSTIKTHRRNLLQKFQAKNLFCLLRLACRENLLKNDSNYCGCCPKQFGNVDF